MQNFYLYSTTFVLLYLLSLFFLPFLSIENHPSTDVLMMNVCDKLKDEVFMLCVEFSFLR